MPVYAKKVQSSNPRFHNREIIIMAGKIERDINRSNGSVEAESRIDDKVLELETKIPIPDDVVLCNGCNENVPEGYLVYLGKREMVQNRPYDIYCFICLKKYFPKAIIVE